MWFAAVETCTAEVDIFHSFFGTQDGDFSLSIRSISALQEVPKDAITDAEGESWLDPSLEKGYNSASQRHVPRGSVSSNVSNPCPAALQKSGANQKCADKPLAKEKGNVPSPGGCVCTCGLPLGWQVLAQL